MITLVECPVCTSLHRSEYHGDCRNDDERYANLEDFTERTGIAEFDGAGTLQVQQIREDQYDQS